MSILTNSNNAKNLRRLSAIRVRNRLLILASAYAIFSQLWDDQIEQQTAD
jgi:hypothetical protein